MEVIPRSGVGSGFIIDKKGYILTNNHVIENASLIEVTLSGGKKLKAKLIGRDPVSDLAVIKIPHDSLSSVVLGDSDALKVGQRAIAIGNPFGLENTLTVGIVSALNRRVRITEGAELSRVIQTDAIINPGNSGGPLINSKGEVIGITSAIYSTSGGAQGIGFAIPINTAKDIVYQLVKKGKVIRPWIGILNSFSVTPNIAEALGLPFSGGVMIGRVVQGGPAHRAGLKRGDRRVMIGNTIVVIGGDIITEFGGKQIRDVDGLIQEIHKKKVGETVKVVVIKNGNKEVYKVKLKGNPKTD